MVELPFHYPEKDSGNMPPNTICVGKTLSNFCRHAPYDIANVLGRRLCSVYYWKRSSEDATELRSGMEKTVGDFLSEAHPFYSRLKNEEDIKFIRCFIAGALAFYNCYINPHSITSEIVDTILGAGFGKVFAESLVVPKNALAQGDINMADRIFINNEFGDYVNAYRLVEAVLEGAVFDSKENPESKEVIIAHLLVWYIVHHMGAEDIAYCMQPYLVKKSLAYNALFEGFASHYMGIKTGNVIAKEGEKRKHRFIQGFIYDELLCITTGTYKVKQCTRCHRYFVHVSNKHSPYCSAECQKIKTYWEQLVDTARNTLAEERNLPGKNETWFIDELNYLFTYEKIMERLDVYCHEPYEYDVYMAMILGALYAREEYKKENKWTTNFTDRERLVKFLKGEESLLDKDIKETILEFQKIKSDKIALREEPPKMWLLARDYLRGMYRNTKI